MGDNIYGDTERMDVLRQKYQQLLTEPGYQDLQASGCRILATWDDHDYGKNDAGVEYTMKKESQSIFLETFAVAPTRSPWSRPGIYDSYTLGSEGKSLQVILLDTRYFRSELLRKKTFEKGSYRGRYAENTRDGATVLGAEQWAWLERELQKPADLRVIVSSIQVLAIDHFWERWQNYPNERTRFLNLLKKTDAKNTILLSGDRHLAEIMKMPASDPQSPGFPVFEITSSGLNQTFDRGGDEPNRYRLGNNFTGANFGFLSIDWKARLAEAEIRDVNGKVVRTVPIRFPQ